MATRKHRTRAQQINARRVREDKMRQQREMEVPIQVHIIKNVEEEKQWLTTPSD